MAGLYGSCIYFYYIYVYASFTQSLEFYLVCDGRPDEVLGLQISAMIKAADDTVSVVLGRKLEEELLYKCMISSVGEVGQ